MKSRSPNWKVQQPCSVVPGVLNHTGLALALLLSIKLAAGPSVHPPRDGAPSPDLIGRKSFPGGRGLTAVHPSLRAIPIKFHSLLKAPQHTRQSLHRPTLPSKSSTSCAPKFQQPQTRICSDKLSPPLPALCAPACAPRLPSLSSKTSSRLPRLSGYGPLSLPSQDGTATPRRRRPRRPRRPRRVRRLRTPSHR